MMKLILNHKQWIEQRRNGLGASEASAIVGINPYMSNIELWEYKIGLKEPEDISEKSYVKYGTIAELPLRVLFRMDYPQYDVKYYKYDMVRNEKYPFIFATLDGRLIEKETERKGILEIKTTEILRSMQKEKWNESIPDNYYIQILHQLLATGWEFVKLKAQLKYQYDDEVYLQTKHYHIERSEVKDDLEYLLEQEVKFWNENVLKKIKPNLILPNI